MRDETFRVISGIALDIYSREVEQHKVLLHHAGEKSVCGVSTYMEIFEKVKDRYEKEVTDGTS